jgi:Uma2 family endonuclease
VEDNEPLETPQHLKAMNVLIDSLRHAWADRQDVYIGGNMFLYFSPDQVRNHGYCGPDFFVVQHTRKDNNRQAWVVWEEGGRTPDLVVELLSTSTKNFDLDGKKTLYRKQLKTPDYVVCDPLDPDSLLQGWHLHRNRYQKLRPNDRGWLWCESLGLWLGTWFGTIKQETGTWLRFYDVRGQLLLLPEEDERRQTEEKQRQTEEEQRLKEEALRQVEEERRLKEEERRLKEEALRQAEEERRQKEEEHRQKEEALRQAEEERRQKEEALRQAEEEHYQKEEALRQAEAALQQAAQERQRFKQLMEQLQAQGIDVDNF